MPSTGVQPSSVRFLTDDPEKPAYSVLPKLTAMTWKCPACQTTIRRDNEATPILGVIYRCHICRLELVMDELQPGKMTLAPMPSTDVPKPPPLHGSSIIHHK
jgi:hypothetical protein